MPARARRHMRSDLSSIASISIEVSKALCRYFTRAVAAAVPKPARLLFGRIKKRWISMLPKKLAISANPTTEPLNLIINRVWPTSSEGIQISGKGVLGSSLEIIRASASLLVSVKLNISTSHEFQKTDSHNYKGYPSNNKVDRSTVTLECSVEP